MKKIILAGLAFALILGLGFSVASRADEDQNKNHDQNQEARAVGSTLEIHISDNGKVLVRGAKVTGVSGNTINAAITWGSASFNWAVNTDANTELVRRFGGNASLAEISVGDFVSFQGMLVTNVVSPITVQARVVKDWSIQRKHGSFAGTVSSADAGAQSFVLASEDRGNIITVKVASSTKIMKGDAAGVFADITVGAKVTASGLFNNLSKVLDADMVKVHLPGAQRTTVEGTIKSVASATLPTTMVITSEGKDYTVNVSADTSVLNALWLRASLSAFHAGDKVRVYGTVNANATIDATVVRDTLLR